MEEEKKLSFVSNGVAKLPPGFQFEPTDEEIVFEYLKCKVLGVPLPAAVIPEINVCEYDPWDLPGEVEKDKYFFCSEKMNVMRSRVTTCSGFWKWSGEERMILSSRSEDNNRLIGLRKTMVFFKGNTSSNITEWRMHEYHMMILTRSSSADSKSQQLLNKSSLALGGWSICHILKKKKNSNKPATVNYKLMTLNKRVREESDIDIDSSDDGIKLSKLHHNGAKTCSSSSCCSWSSTSESETSLSSVETEESSCSSSSCLH